MVSMRLERLIDRSMEKCFGSPTIFSFMVHAANLSILRFIYLLVFILNAVWELHNNNKTIIIIIININY